MSVTPLAHTNGSKPTHTSKSTNGSQPAASPQPAASSEWLRRSVKQFFSAVNWDNYSPEIQQLKQTAAQGNPTAPLSLTLSVSQFFAAVSWEGTSVAAPTAVESLSSDNSEDVFTLEDFSDLF